MTTKQSTTTNHQLTATLQQLMQSLAVIRQMRDEDSAELVYVHDYKLYPGSPDDRQFDACIRNQQLDRLECIMQVNEFNALQELNYEEDGYFAANIEQLIRMVDLGRINKADNVRLNNEVKTAGEHYLGHLLDQM